MRHWLKEKEPAGEPVQLADLEVGCVVGLGFMPQKNLSGRRLPITEINSYLFDEDSFISYRLEDDDTDINLIVADDAHNAGTYLALSLRLNELMFASLFVSPLPQDWFALKKDEVIDVSSRVLGAPRGWFASRYRLAMKARGSKLDGDFRLRDPLERANVSRPFDYVLFVDDANNHALEAERYDDGSLSVLATVYRPSTDIGEITRPIFQDVSLISDAEPELPLFETLLDVKGVSIIEHEPPTMDKPLKMATETPVEVELPLHTKFGRIQPANIAAKIESYPETLACDTRLAGRIISEAQRNQMALSELVRKVIDLPAKIKDQVFIPFALEDAEYAELARRYDVPASDREAVRQQILEELRNFIGETKNYIRKAEAICPGFSQTPEIMQPMLC